MEDYLQMLLQLVNLGPDVLFLSSALPLAFRASMGGLTVIQHDIIFASLDFIHDVLTHDCLRPQPPVPRPKFQLYAEAIKKVMNDEGLSLLVCLLSGLVGEFPPEAAATVVEIFRSLVHVWPTQLLAWLPPVLEQLPTRRKKSQTF